MDSDNVSPVSAQPMTAMDWAELAVRAWYGQRAPGRSLQAIVASIIDEACKHAVPRGDSSSTG